VSGKPVTHSGSPARTTPESRAAVTDSPATGLPDAMRDSDEPASDRLRPSESRSPASRDHSSIFTGSPTSGAMRMACRFAYVTSLRLRSTSNIAAGESCSTRGSSSTRAGVVPPETAVSANERRPSSASCRVPIGSKASARARA